MRRVWQGLFLGLTLLTFGVCVAVPVGNYLLYSTRPFDADRWQRGDSRQRARMVADLRFSGILLGKSRNEVVELLGPPDREYGSGLEYDYIHGDLLSQLLDLPFANWRQWVWIEFDEESGQVQRVEMRD